MSQTDRASSPRPSSSNHSQSSASAGQANPSDSGELKDRVHGEGNYQATRDYNRDTKAFVDAAKVDEAARRAAPESEDEARAMKQAEDKGAGRARS